MLYILSDVVQAGKTTWLVSLVEACRYRGISPDGVISPAIFDEAAGEKTGISCRLLPQDEVITLGIRRDLVKPGDVDFPATPLRWVFSRCAMGRVNEHLARTTVQCPSRGLFLVDELGWLEMLDGGGFFEALRVLDRRCYRDALVVVRPELVDRAVARWSLDDEVPQVLKLADVGVPGEFLDRIGAQRG